jgi:hypothetical protein
MDCLMGDSTASPTPAPGAPAIRESAAASGRSIHGAVNEGEAALQASRSCSWSGADGRQFNWAAMRSLPTVKPLKRYVILFLLMQGPQEVLDCAEAMLRAVAPRQISGPGIVWIDERHELCIGARSDVPGMLLGDSAAADNCNPE